MRDLTELLRTGADLDTAQVGQAVAALLDPEQSDAMKSEFLRALHMKGETANEIASFAGALLARAVNPEIDAAKLSGPMIDVCGTGGDRMELFNVSTAVMFLLAAAGAAVVKHGNRGITSKAGGADVLEALGIRIEYPPDLLRECLAATGMAFIFAPAYHPSVKAIGPVRKALGAEGVTTIFNILGPLLNPASPPFQLAGIFAESLLPKYAEVLCLLGRESAWAVHGTFAGGGGVDELSTLGMNHYCAVKEGEVSAHKFMPEPLGFRKAQVEELRGGDAGQNAYILSGILEGHIHGPKRDVVILNSAAGLVVCGFAPDLAKGVGMADELLKNGAAFAKLKALREFSAAHP